MRAVQASAVRQSPHEPTVRHDTGTRHDTCRVVRMSPATPQCQSHCPLLLVCACTHHRSCVSPSHRVSDMKSAPTAVLHSLNFTPCARLAGELQMHCNLSSGTTCVESDYRGTVQVTLFPSPSRSTHHILVTVIRIVVAYEAAKAKSPQPAAADPLDCNNRFNM